jgi:phage baseplate assembly protein gpV
MSGPQRAPSDHVADPLQLLRVGRIVGVDLPAATCIVEIGDTDSESVETTDIQWGTLRAGKTRIWSPPSEGEQVLLFCPNGDIAQAVPLGALFCAGFPAPGDSERGLIEFGDGAVIAYDPDAHHLDFTLPGGATTRIESDGGVTIVGDVTVEGDVIADGVSLKQHVHEGVQPGAGVSGMPQA